MHAEKQFENKIKLIIRGLKRKINIDTHQIILYLLKNK